ncbi:MAG: hypothetical protein EHM75_11760, partial [Desulfobacteraceae bacterium]
CLMRRFYVFVFLAFLFSSVLILSGCTVDSKVARVPEPPPAVIPPPIQAKAPELPSELPALQSLPKPSELEEGIFKERLYSLSYREAEVRDVLMAFSRESSYNMIVDPEVSGRITVDLKRVTMFKALDSLLKPLGLEFEKEGSFIKVTRPKMVTRVYDVNYLTSVRSGRSLVLGSTTGSSGTTSSSGGTSTTTTSGGQSSSVESSDKADFWGQLIGEKSKEGSYEGGIGSLLTKPKEKGQSAEAGSMTGAPGKQAPGAEHRSTGSEKGTMVVNKITSTIAVTDFPKIHQEIEKYLNKISRVLNRQVLIEAQIIEVTLADRFQLGIDWRFLPQMTNAGFGWTANQNIGGAAVPSSWQVPVATSALTAGISTLNFTSMIDALSQQGQVNVISKPRVSTLNNQRAIIKAATDDIYFEITISTSTGGPPIITATPRVVTIGVVLDVTPQIDADGNILLDVQPSVTEEVTRRTQQVGVSGTTPILTEAPVVSVRQAQTVARVKNGQTIVIAGLLREKKRNVDTGVPGLMEIPLLGYLFKTTSEIKDKSELVFLITPHIQNDPQILDFTRQDLDRARDLQDKKRLDERVFCPTCPK